MPQTPVGAGHTLFPALHSVCHKNILLFLRTGGINTSFTCLTFCVYMKLLSYYCNGDCVFYYAEYWLDPGALDMKSQQCFHSINHTALPSSTDSLGGLS